jgi:hypothetical protein
VLPAWLDATAGTDDTAGTGATPAKGWTPIGLPDDGTCRWIVDPGGGVAPAAGAWSVEWWIGADDRWHVPAREGTARQRLVDAAPVVETRVRVAGGDVVITEWAVPAGTGVRRVTVGIRNESAAAVALAAVLRPWGPAGMGSITRVACAGGALHAVAAPGTVTLSGDIAPAHLALPGDEGGDAGLVVLAGGSRPLVDSTALDPDGWASGALVWPLARQASVGIAVTAGPERAAPTGAGNADAGAVVRGWQARVGRATRIELPEGPLASALAANRARLLLAPGWPGIGRPGEALVVGALASSGCREEAAAVLETWLPTRPGARIGTRTGEVGAVLWAAGEWRSSGPDDAGLIARSGLAIGEAAEWLGRTLARARHAASSEQVWGIAGLQAAARLLTGLGEADAARAVDGWVADAIDALAAALGGGSGADVVAAGLLAAHLGALDAGAPAAAVRQAAAQLNAADVVPRLLLAASTARAGTDPTAVLAPLLGAANPTWSWPAPADVYDPVVAAGWWAVARAVLLEDRSAPAGRPALRLFPAFPAAWIGREVEVHGLATAAGRVSWALRWHGPRPALLWEIDGEGADVEVTAPGLDPAWSARGRRGDALLRS